MDASLLLTFSHLAAGGDSGGQGSLAWCSPWGCKESDRAERLTNNSKIYLGWEDGVELKKFLLVFPYCLSSYL